MVLLEVVGAVPETGAVTAVDILTAAELLVDVEEPSSVDIPCTIEGHSGGKTKIQVDQNSYCKAMCL